MKEKKVFISYSHDTSEHKKWVGRFASDLVKNGVDVVLDQWDTSFGDNLTKFMEKSISEADRILLICTDEYVRKANDGIGGVGYESMIVTGKMIKDIATNKFIPIIRQKDKRVPDFLSTRKYSDFSDDNLYTESLEELLREIHQAPALPKPPLGKNPFEKDFINIQQSPELIPSDNDDSNIQSLVKKVRNAIIIKNMYEWKKAVQHAKKDYSRLLLDWVARYERSVPNNFEQLKPIILEAVSIYEPLIAISLVGVESGEPEFSSHTAFLDEILYLRKWKKSGYSVYVNIEKTIAFLFQALHGSTGMFNKNIKVVDELAHEIIRIDTKRQYLWNTSSIVGYPESLGRSSENGWITLKDLYSKWSWLAEIFPSNEDYVSSLCSYYMFLSLLEFLNFLNEPYDSIDRKEKYFLKIPVFFLKENENSRQGYRQFLSNKEYLRNMFSKSGKEINEIKKHWDLFKNNYQRYFGPNYFYIESEDIFSNMPMDVLGIV